MTPLFGRPRRTAPFPPGPEAAGRPPGPRGRKGNPALVAALVLAGALAGLVALRASWQEKAYQARIAALQEENQGQQFDLQRFSERLETIQRQLERLENFQAKLKIIADLDLQDDDPEASLSAGGFLSDASNRDLSLEREAERRTQRLEWELEELRLEASVLEHNSYRVEEFFDLQRSLIAATPTIWPVEGWVSSPFGLRLSPFNNSLQMHQGIDIGGRADAPILATADGLVIYTGWKSESGKTVILEHGYGYVTSYCHLSRIYCANGQRVKRGTVIGALGNTGKSTGYHLHYEVKLNGVPVNPENHLLD